MKALGNNLIVESIPLTTSTGGLITPEAYAPDEVLFRVLSVGPGRRSNKTGERIPIEVLPGQRVLSRAHNSVRFEHEGRELRVLNASEILMAFPDERKINCSLS
jgi:chaperonin GroES